MEAPVIEDSLPNEQGSKSSGNSYQDYMSQDEDGPRDTAWYRSAHKIRKKKDLASQNLRTDPGGPSALPIHEDVGMFPFLALPRELRDLIYEDLLTLRRLPGHTTSKKWHHGTAHTSILCTCRQIRDEASKVLYSNQLLISFTGEILGCAVEWVKVGKYTEMTRYEELTENESWRAWPQVPAYYYKCDSFRIHVGMGRGDYTEYDQDIIEEAALRAIMDFNSVVHTVLLKHPSLRTVHFELTTLPVDVDARFSDEFMQNYELRPSIRNSNLSVAVEPDAISYNSTGVTSAHDLRAHEGVPQDQSISTSSEQSAIFVKLTSPLAKCKEAREKTTSQQAWMSLQKIHVSLLCFVQRAYRKCNPLHCAHAP